jgi:prepilin-type N-terminal cleavage/methylation domain-containing protein
MECHNLIHPSDKGFTLVEISIVMIIIGLLIGGIFGGMKLVDNANVQRTVQDIKAIESSALTFRDIYRALPGDIRNPNTRIPNCTVAPCATTGNGNRQIGVVSVTAQITNTDENFTFWHHLQAANLVQMDYSNTLTMDFGEGAPSSPIGGGYRLNNITGGVGFCLTQFTGTQISVSGAPSADWTTAANVSCDLIRGVDVKMDDGLPASGLMIGGWGCEVTAACNSPWPNGGSGILWYDLKGF